jgi:hypothetical protein
MQAVIRQYSGKGAAELFDLLEKNATGVEAMMRGVKGFVSYTLARTDSGGFTVTVCKDKAGVDESIQKAREWISQNASTIGASAPVVSAGSVVMYVK